MGLLLSHGVAKEYDPHHQDPVSAQIPIPAQLTSDLELEAKLELVLGVRKVHIGNSIREEVLIKWKGLPAFEATKEDVTLTSQRVPSFHLEDKVALAGGGNIRHQAQSPGRDEEEKDIDYLVYEIKGWESLES
ncbi:hypothetical protein AgCh_013062 [Apium graveolens]